MVHIDDPVTQKANLNYIRTAMKTPLLEREEEKELAMRWKHQRDEKALHTLIESYTRLVVSIASKFKHYGLPMGDLIQEGNVGLMQAASRFEPERDLRFSTYASWWVRSTIQDYILRNWSIVRTGTTSAQKSLFFNYRRLRAAIEGREEVEALNDNHRQEIATALNVKLRDVEDMEQRLSGGDASLNARVSEDGDDEWQNMIADEEALNPEDVVIGMKDAESRTKWLNQALGELTDREQQIIRQRHLTHDGITLEQLGDVLGVSKERVRQLEQRAMGKLKTYFSKNLDNPQNWLSEG
ncbi:MAG: RNA polymerase factor sigma-32 [Rhodospirillales bacterium]|nr:RNA polymerase factor sigma-32 [Rhodospirillales bacterium]